jgi:hypothetical protein
MTKFSHLHITYSTDLLIIIILTIENMSCCLLLDGIFWSIGNREVEKFYDDLLFAQIIL